MTECKEVIEMKLAITQVVLGALIASSTCFVLRWGFPTQFSIPSPDGQGNISILVNAGPPILWAYWLAMLAFALGLVVLGVGIAQLIKVRKFV